jgi:hypothetical protein
MCSRELNSDWLLREGFTALPAARFLSAPEQVRDTMGVYMVLLRGIVDFLAGSGLPNVDALLPWSVQDYVHCYTGESVAMRSRALLHLCGTVRDSAVREFLLALQVADEAIWPGSDENLIEMEAKLSKWLSMNALVAFRPCGYVQDVEKDLIVRMPSPFNIRGNVTNPLARALKAKRNTLRAHLRETGQLHHREPRPPSAWLVGQTMKYFCGEPAKLTRPSRRSF